MTDRTPKNNPRQVRCACGPSCVSSGTRDVTAPKPSPIAVAPLRPILPRCRGFVPLVAAVLLVVGRAGAEPAPTAATDNDAAPLRKTDVCVYAATPSGILAAVAVKRAGKDVLLVEPSRWVGGMLGAGIKPKQDCPMPEAVGGLAKQVVTAFGKTPEDTRAAFMKLLTEHQVPVLYEHRVCGVEKDGQRITRVRLEKAPPDRWGCPVAQALPGPGVTVEAKMYIDASYEGDVLAQAGVKYAVGREPRSKYDEDHAGVGRPTNVTPLDPYVKPGDPASGLLKWVEPNEGKALGDGDDYTQAYNFRFYVTADPDRCVPFTPPDDYNPQQYELVGRYVAYLVAEAEKSGRKPPLDKIFPGWMNSGEYNYFRESLFSMAPLGVSRRYQDGDYATRAAIWKLHIDYLRGLQHFMATDPRVPKAYREKMAELGLDRTHHPDTDGWPYQLYVRVARRMLGRYVLTEADVMNRTKVDDSVGLALYGVDTYPVRRMVLKQPDGTVAVATEGNMFIGGNRGTGVPYGIPYRTITPQADQCTNLLVPVCFSASYIAYASSRMEPVFMLLGESAGVAAVQSIDQQTDVQKIDVPRLQQSLLKIGQLIAWPDPKPTGSKRGRS